MNTIHLARGLERLSACSSASNSPRNSPQLARKVLGKTFTSLSAGNTPHSSPLVNRLSDHNGKSSPLTIRSRNFSTAKILHDSAEWAEETPMEVFLSSVLDKPYKDEILHQQRNEIIHRTRSALATAGISNVGQLRESSANDLEKLGVTPDVIQKIRNAFEGSPSTGPRFQAAVFQTNATPTPISVPSITINEAVKDPSPAIAQAEWCYKQGTSKPFINKTPELFWSEYQESRTEAAWLRKERAFSSDASPWQVSGDPATTEKEDPLGFYNEWKHNKPGKLFTPWTPAVNLKEEVLIRPGMSYSGNLAEIRSQTSDDADKKSDWSVASNRRDFFDALGNKLNIHSLSDWYYVNAVDLKKYDAAQEILRTYYDNSLPKALVSIYPDFNWKMWNFDNGFKGIWNNEPDTQILEKVAEENKGNPRSQDLNSTVKNYKNHWQVRLFSTTAADSLAYDAVPFSRPREPARTELLQEGMQIIPNRPLNAPTFPVAANGPFEFEGETEQKLYGAVQELFPGAAVAKDYGEPAMRYSDSQRPFRVSAYIPESKIAFDFVEDPNYSWQYTFGAKFSAYIFNQAKREVCERLGITLIEIPSWWDGKKTSVATVIKRVRPDLLSPSKSQEVPVNVADAKSYFLSRRSKGMKQCAACKNNFREDAQLVVQSRGEKMPKPAYFCLNSRCLGTASGLPRMSKFTGKVAVAKDLKQKLPEVEGIQWIDA